MMLAFFVVFQPHFHAHPPLLHIHSISMSQADRPMDKRQHIKIQMFEARIMTDAEVESVASLLFTWWLRGFENRLDRPRTPASL